MTRTYRIVLPLLGAWLAGWMYLSWPAIQDDALIHLRYADNFVLHHSITYDGVHPDYGASSLLYVTLLALLRGLTASPNLPRAVSSATHGLLFAGLAYGFACKLSKQARLAKVAGAALLVLLVTPSAVRWLDDGMETGIAVLLASLFAWLVHEQWAQPDPASASNKGTRLSLALLAFLAVMLRTELVLLCAAGAVILRPRGQPTPGPWRGGRLHSSFALLAGAALALCSIVAFMRVLLPDTAIAKSHGLSHWSNPLHDAAVTLGGAMSFGLGMLGFWLLTLLLVLQRRRLIGDTALANAFFPLVLALASLRGQEIQGVRYFAWTFVFPVVWNILELARDPAPDDPSKVHSSRAELLLTAFLVLVLVALPFETRAMYRVLTRRAETMQTFQAQHLEVLASRRGVASDIGYIGYFSGARICDLAGLVNGRAAAKLSSLERNEACMRTGPDFLFVNISQLGSLTGFADLSAWKVCGRYDFTNVRTLDRHSLIVRPEIADEVCRATGRPPEPFAALLMADPQRP